MASTDGNTFLQDFGRGLLDLTLDYGRTKLIDVETADSDRNIPDTNDLVNGDARIESSHTLGGAYALGGFTPMHAALIGGGLLLAAIIVKKVL